MIYEVTNLWAYGWVQGEKAGQKVGFGPPRGHYEVDQVTFAPAQGHYLVNLNHIPFVSAQDHYEVEQLHPDPPQEHHQWEPVRAVRHLGRLLVQQVRLDQPQWGDPVRVVWQEGG